MNRKRFMLLAVVLVAVNAFFWLAQGGFALTAGVIDQLFGGRMIRAEVVVQGANGTEDYLIDRGVIKAITPGSIVLRENDAKMVTIQIATTPAVTGRKGTGRTLRVGMRVIVTRLANAPADSIQVEGFGP
ncbi:MAG TPA: hypothetical protein VF327_03495 [Gaiellaceae bacterium]